MIITLIGYRGTGKSTIAAPMAERLGYDWIDADVELEARARRSIKEIFDTDGEPEFRRLERETLVALLERDNIIIAAGGGAILNEETRNDFQNAGHVVWLQASADSIESRLYGDSTTGQRRPNLTSRGGRAEIEDLLKIREPLYQQCATISVSTDKLTPDEIVDHVIHQIRSDS
ncbi:MAG: shikimate kinase [Planctomycetaceae bacterium]|nr:shikimate kinase [Planctomycetaceae bacterium]